MFWKKKRKTPHRWKDDEVDVLLKSWKDHVYLKHCVQKGNINLMYICIAKDLLNHGYKRPRIEIDRKMRTLRKFYRLAKKSEGTDEVIQFKWTNEVKELLKLERDVFEFEGTSRDFIEQEMKRAYETYAEEVCKETAPITYQGYSTSDLPTYTLIETSTSDVPNKSQRLQARLAEQSERKLERNARNFLQKLSGEFERSSSQRDENNKAMLDLFREQNDIFKTQTSLIVKLLLK